MKVKSGQRYFKSMHMSGTGKLPLVPEADVVLVHFAAEPPISPVFPLQISLPKASGFKSFVLVPYKSKLLNPRVPMLCL